MDQSKPAAPRLSREDASSPAPQPDWRQRALLSAGVLTLAVACAWWVYRALNPPEDDHVLPGPRPAAVAKQETIPPPKSKTAADDFLSSFRDKVDSDDGDTAPVLTNEHLERKLDELGKIQDRSLALMSKLQATPEGKTPDEASLKELKAVEDQMNKDLSVLEQALRRARKARPKDPVPEWLTGELLIVVRAEPDMVMPYFRRALDTGFKNARLLASLSRIQVGANDFDTCLKSATAALDLSPQDFYAWNAYKLAAFSLERFDDVLERLKKAFPEKAPDWAVALRREAADLQEHWQAEQKLRQHDAEVDDLPRVRLVIEHRRFAVQNGKPTDKIETTGTGEVIVELFEDQAPNTVANFLTLVSSKFYDGTKFFQAMPASFVVGGCPLTKNADPADDGNGDPGYFIADEFASPKARRHFRGTLSTENFRQPNTAGSQFLITLVPIPMFDGQHTVFGRIIKGQETIDRITQGRTHPDVVPFGRIIPGDLLVRAEVIRKRDHEYRVTKVQKEP